MPCTKTIEHALGVALSYLQHSLVPPPYTQKLFHDSIILVRVLGKPNLFVTKACNPTWLEILDEPGQSPHDCPNILVRVFELSLRTLMDEITK
jgi:hypothetical protein